MDRTLTHVEYFALIVSALCHDLEHPGVNNPFLVSSRSDLATLYNDRSASATRAWLLALPCVLTPT